MDGLDYLLMTEAGGDDPSMSMGKDASSMSMMESVGLRPTPSPADRGRELLKRNDSLYSFCSRFSLCRLNLNFGIHFRGIQQSLAIHQWR